MPAILLVLFLTGCVPRSHLARGKQYLDNNKYDNAIKELEKAANEKGDIYYYIDAYSYLGDAYAKSGRKNQAVSIYRNALQIIHLRLREISARRTEIRRELNSKSKVKAHSVQDEDMRLGDEEWRLKESEKDIKIRLKGLTDAR